MDCVLGMREYVEPSAIVQLNLLQLSSVMLEMLQRVVQRRGRKLMVCEG